MGALQTTGGICSKGIVRPRSFLFVSILPIPEQNGFALPRSPAMTGHLLIGSTNYCLLPPTTMNQNPPFFFINWWLWVASPVKDSCLTWREIHGINSRDRVTAVPSQPLSEGGEGTKDNGDEIRVRVTKAGTPSDRQLGCRGACNKKEATLVHKRPYSGSGIHQPVGQKGNLCLWETQLLTLPLACVLTTAPLLVAVSRGYPRLGV